MGKTDPEADHGASVAMQAKQYWWPAARKAAEAAMQAKQVQLQDQKGAWWMQDQMAARWLRNQTAAWGHQSHQWTPGAGVTPWAPQQELNMAGRAPRTPQ